MNREKSIEQIFLIKTENAFKPFGCSPNGKAKLKMIAETFIRRPVTAIVISVVI